MKPKNKRRISQYTLDATLLENLLTSKGVERLKISGQGVMRAGEGTVRGGQAFNASSSFNLL